MKLSVVIPTLRRPDILARALDALERQTASADAFEVLIVRDAADEDEEAVTKAVAARRRKMATRLLRASRRGASAARNVGWRAARSRLILFLGDDIIAAPQLIAEHLAWHERRGGQDVGVLGHVRWARTIRVTPLMRWLEHGIEFDYPGIAGDEARWFNFYTSNVSVPRPLLEEIGGFDEERFPFNYEDLDLGYRLHRRGFRLLYNPEAIGEHLHSQSLDQWRYRMSTTATAERRWVSLYPELPAYFHDKLAEAAALPPARGRGRALLRWVGPEFPVIGARAWRSADIYYRQQLAPSFLEVWRREERDQTPTPASRERRR